MVHLFVHLASDGALPKKGYFQAISRRTDHVGPPGQRGSSDRAAKIVLRMTVTAPAEALVSLGYRQKGQVLAMSPELVDQLPDLERQADELERKADAIRQIIAGVRALNGDASAVLTRRSFESHRTSFEIAPPDRSGPRGPEAVLQVMREDPDRAWKVVELKRELLRRGWAPTPKAVEASVKRLRVDNRILPVSYGHYRLARREAGDRSESVEPKAVRPGPVEIP